MASEEVLEAAEFIAERIGVAPRMALVLGSGLGGLADEIESPVALEYREIPHFPSLRPPAMPDCVAGELLAGKRVIAVQGRFALHTRAYPMERVVFPVRVFRGPRGRAAFPHERGGGANPYFAPGDFVIIRDHTTWRGRIPASDPRRREHSACASST